MGQAEFAWAQRPLGTPIALRRRARRGSRADAKGTDTEGQDLAMSKSKPRGDYYLPTPDDIEREASKIRAEWSVHERRRREGRRSPRGEIRLGRIVSLPRSLREWA